LKNGKKRYILVAIEYVTKWAKVQTPKLILQKWWLDFDMNILLVDLGAH
jgi:hypothetical protein